MGHYDHRVHAGNAGDVWKHFLLLEAADCLLDIDGNALGRLITGKERVVKLVMAEHKEAVSAILRAIAAGHDAVSSTPGGVLGH